MPFFRYTANDKNGLPVEGTMQAADMDAALRALQQAGFQPLDVGPVGATRRHPAQSRLAPAPVSAPPPQAAARATASAPTGGKAGRGDTKALYLLLTQLSSFYKSGIAPSDAVMHLAERAPKAYADSLTDIASSVGRGDTLADSFERYPTLYPPHVVGMTRAGEAAGNVEESLAIAGDTAFRAHRLWRRASYVLYYLAAFTAVAPMSVAFVEGALSSVRLQDESGGSLPPVQTLMNEVTSQLGRLIWVSLAIVAAWWLLLHVWNLHRCRMFRHTLGLRLPVLGKRARQEGISRFSWALAQAMRAGLPAYAAMNLAAAAIPNLRLRDNLEREVGAMRENEPLSAAMRRSKLVPPEWIDMVQTGEMTGTTPSALAQLSSASSAEYEAVDQSLPYILYVAGLIVTAIVALPIIVYLWSSWYGGLIKALLHDV
jgi:type II secretory pathway component PulF